jgi:gentisate 1,2-dioxygenase
MEPQSPYGLNSPIFSYPYDRARAALLALKASIDPDPYNGYALRYANPLDGGWVMPMIAAWLSHLPKGFQTAPYRATDNQVIVVSEGEVCVEIGGNTYDLKANDVMALPGWTWRTLTASAEAVLFHFSDRSAQEKLGLWKEDRGNQG